VGEDPSDARQRRTAWEPRVRQIVARDAILPPEAWFEPGLGSAEAWRVEDFGSTPCLVLLGPPGSGRTTAVVWSLPPMDSRSRFTFQFGASTSTERDFASLRESDALQRWRGGEAGLDLILDDLDLAGEGVERVLDRLGGLLRGGPQERLRLRIIVQTGFWPDHGVELVAKAAELDPAAVRVGTLAPLTRADFDRVCAVAPPGVETAAVHDRLERLGLLALVAEPQWLMPTLEVLRSDEAASRSTIVEHVCRVCIEHACSRLRLMADDGDPELWIEAASYLAAGTLLSGCLDLDIKTLRPLALAERHLALPSLTTALSEHDPALPSELRPTVERLNRVARRSGLLGPKDVNGEAWRWLCEPLGSWLAQRFVASRLAPAQLQNLVFHPRGGVVPSLGVTAGWLIDLMPPQVWRWAVETDPEVVVDGDLSLRADEERAFLVERLLERYRSGSDVSVGRARLGGLRHERLTEQLRPILLNRDEDPIARRVAQDIAAANLDDDLRDALLQVACCADESTVVRSRALSVLQGPFTPAMLVRLRQLMHVNARPEGDDDLLGAALGLLWDADALDIEAVIDALRPPRGRARYGWYGRFVWKLPSRVVERSGAAGLVRLLQQLTTRWAELKPRRFDLTMGQLVEGGLTLAVSTMDAPGMVEAAGGLMAQTIDLQRFSSGAGLSRALARKSEGRRLLLRHLCERGDSIPVIVRMRLLDTEVDLDWMLASIEATDDPAPYLEVCLAHTWPPEAFLELLGLYHRDPRRYAALESWVKVDLGTESAKAQRHAHERRLAMLPTARYKEELSARAVDGEALSKLTSGIDKPVEVAWREVLNGMESRGGRDDPEVYLPIWAELEPSLRASMLSVGLGFLREVIPPADDVWPKTSLVTRVLLEGHKALVLLEAFASEWLDQLPSEAWSRWLPALFLLHEFKRPTLQRAIDRAPEGVLRLLNQVLAAANATRATGVLDKLRPFWRPGWTAVLRDALATPSGVSPIALPGIVTFCWSVKPELAREFVAVAFDEDSGWQWDDNSLAQIFVGLLGAAPNEFQGIFWERTEHNVALRERILLGVIGTAYLESLETESLLSVWLWMLERYPSSQDPRALADESESAWGTRTLTPRDHLGDLRKECQDALVLRGTWEVVDAMREAARRFRDEDTLRWALGDAERIARARTWTPAGLLELLRLARDPDRRVVYEQAHLIVLLRELMTAERLRVRDFWERVPGDRFQPVLEVQLRYRLASFVRCELERCVVNREVVVEDAEGRFTVTTRVPGGPAHERLDVVVLANDSIHLAERLERVRHEDDRPREVAVVVAAFGGAAWSPHAGAGRLGAIPVERVQTCCSEVLGGRVSWVVADLTFSEGFEDVERALPWANQLRAELDRAAVAVRRVWSIGDSEVWHLQCHLPKPFEEQFGVSQDVLLVATDRELRKAVIDAAVREQRHSGGELDLDLLIVASSHEEVDKQLAWVPGERGQWIAWRFGETSPMLEAVLWEGLPRFDIFDQTRPVRGNQLFGRHDALAAARRLVLRGESLGVFGLRKVGKTSLVRAITDNLGPASMDLGRSPCEPLKSDAVVIWQDAQSLAPLDEASLVALCHRHLAERLHRLGAAVDASPSWPSWREGLRGLLADPDRRVCLVFDEFDYLFEGPTGVETLLRILRGLAQETGRLSAVFIGRDPTKLTQPELGGMANPMLGWLHETWIGPLDRPASDAMLKTLGARVGLAIGDETVERAWRWSGGHPSLHRQFGSAVMAAAHRLKVGGRPIHTDDQLLATAEDIYLDEKTLASETIPEEVWDLLSKRYPASWEMFVAMCRDPAALEKAPGGWRSKEARLLRNFGLIQGSRSDPWVAETFRSYVLAWVPAGDKAS